MSGQASLLAGFQKGRRRRPLIRTKQDHIFWSRLKILPLRALPMPQITADPPAFACYCLFFKEKVPKFQRVNPFFVSRGRGQQRSGRGALDPLGAENGRRSYALGRPGGTRQSASPWCLPTGRLRSNFVAARLAETENR